MNMSRGWIYFAVNDAMPGLIKVGFTSTDLHTRVSTLDTTGVPAPFLIGAAFMVTEPEICEKRIHDALGEARFRSEREFFRIPLPDALSIAWPILHDFIGIGSANEIVQQSTKYDDIDEVESCVLEVLGNQPDYEAEEWAIATKLRNETIEIAHHLHRLKRKGYTRFFKRSTYELWSLTEKGVAFIIDNGLLTRRVR